MCDVQYIYNITPLCRVYHSTVRVATTVVVYVTLVFIRCKAKMFSVCIHTFGILSTIMIKYNNGGASELIGHML